MEKIVKRDKNGRIEVGDGWTRDDSGQIYDPEGFRWFGHEISSSPVESLVKPEDGATIADTGTGDQRIMRFFNCMHPPGKEIPPKEEVLKSMWSYMTFTIYQSGLTTDDNYEPVVRQDERKRRSVILVICKPSKTRVSIYDGMKHGQGTVHKVHGQEIVAHKTDNISTLLNAKPKDPEQIGK